MMADTTSPFEDMRSVRQANADNGFHFFDRGAMRFFKSKVETHLYRGRWFITSEQEQDGTDTDVRGNLIPATPRVYSVRYAEDNGSIETVDGASHLDSFTSALEAMWADINSR